MSTRLPDVGEMIRRLIEAPSVSSVNPALDMGNAAVVALLGEWLEGLGFAVRMIGVGEREDKLDLVATLGPQQGRSRGEGPADGPGEGLVLAGHTDTVPFDESQWSVDPLRSTERDGRIHGLGAADMKAFFALALEAARRVERAALARPLTVLATADEECTMAGARALERAGLRPGRHVVIGEPTGLRPRHTHKGVFMEAIELTGRGAHSSHPALGASALDGMQRVMGGLIAWREQLAREHRDDQFDVPVPTLNLGVIRGGDSPNRVCARCELEVDLRLLPGMEIEPLREALHERVREALAGTDLALGFRTLFEGIPAMRTDRGAAVVRAAEALTGSESAALAIGTEGPIFNRMGMETVILGPGDVEQAHQADESLPLDRIEPGIELIERLIRRLCGDPPA